MSIHTTVKDDQKALITQLEARREQLLTERIELIARANQAIGENAGRLAEVEALMQHVKGVSTEAGSSVSQESASATQADHHIS